MGKDAKFIVRLSAEERKQLNDLVAQGRVAKNTRQRAMILLRVDQGEAGPSWHDERVVELLGVGLSTVHRTREQFVEEGLAATLRRKPSPNRQYRKLDGAGEAQLIAIACSPPPARRRQRAASPGRCSCWPTNWWSCRWWSRSAKKRSARR